MIFNIIYIVFIAIVVIQLSYYFLIFLKFSFISPNIKNYINLPVSVIICAKNEALNLKENLPFIINQDYKNFELIVVNDHSTDDTLNVLQEFKKRHTDLSISILNLNKKKSKGNKKNAVTKGIQVAKNDHLLLTDADCKPNSKHWLSEISSQFNKDKTVVLGYGAYQKITKSWLNKLIRFETLLTAIQYFSYAKIGLPYMGVGRNIAYTKSNFNKANGFKKHESIKSGDDDLFINEIANKQNTAICFTEKSFTISRPHTSFKKWLLQKRRHISTATYYKPTHQLLLGLFYISQFLFWFLAIFLLIYGNKIQLIWFLIVIRIFVQYLIFGISAKKLNEKDLIVYIPFLELFLIVIQMSIFIKNLISKPKHW